MDQLQSITLCSLKSIIKFVFGSWYLIKENENSFEKKAGHENAAQQNLGWYELPNSDSSLLKL